MFLKARPPPFHGYIHPNMIVDDQDRQISDYSPGKSNRLRFDNASRRRDRSFKFSGTEGRRILPRHVNTMMLGAMDLEYANSLGFRLSVRIRSWRTFSCSPSFFERGSFTWNWGHHC